MTRYSWLTVLTLLAIPTGTSACEPVIPLTKLLSGSTLAGPALLTQSLIWLAVAVAIKSGVFAFFERRLAWRQAVLFMLLANVVSTLPGILVGAFTGSGTGFGLIIVLPFVFFLGWLVQRRTVHLPEAHRWPRVTGGGAMLAFIGFFIASMILYYSAENVLSTRNYQTYWLLKFLFVTLVACSGIVISAVLEESIIASVSRKTIGNLSFYVPVFRANYITLGVILLVAALKMLPQRMRSPGFITSWLESFLGITT